MLFNFRRREERQPVLRAHFVSSLTALILRSYHKTRGVMALDGVARSHDAIDVDMPILLKARGLRVPVLVDVPLYL